MALDFSNNPYFDDFDESKNYKKILFKPGYAVQARELNQLQTQLQDQISKLGSHLFKNGAIVIPGSPKLDKSARYVILQDLNSDPDILTKLVGQKLLQDFSGNILRGRVSHAEDLSGYILAIVKYENSATYDDAGETKNQSAFDNATAITVEDDVTFNLQVASQGPSAEPSVGSAVMYSIPSGVFYINGYFVKSEDQSIVVGWEGEADYYTMNKRIGFEVTEEIVTAYDDVSLFDNANGSPNEGAPGADRLAMTLSLVKKSLDADQTNFFEFLRYVNGSIRVNVQYTQYNQLEETLARRTYDESGDYAVGGLDVKVINHLKSDDTPKGLLTADKGGDDNKVAVEVAPGKAYVKGYEVENFSNYYIEVDKPRGADSQKTSINNLQTNQNGEFIYIGGGNQFIDISRHPILWLTDGVESSADIIGYCIPKHLEAFTISGVTVFKLFGSFHLSQSVTFGFQHIGGWRRDALTNGPVLQVATLTDWNTSNFVIDGNALTSHAGYTPYAWDATNTDLYLKKSTSVDAFNTTIQVVKGSAAGYVAEMTYKTTAEDGAGDIIECDVSNIRTVKDELGNVNIQAEMAYTTTITTDANGFGEFTYLGTDGVFVGAPVAAHTGLDNLYFNNLVTISGDGKTLTINNVSYPNAVFSISAQLTKNLSVKTKALNEASTVITNPSSREMVLPHKDIYELVAVYKSPDLSTAPTTAHEDITEYFELVNNDTLDFYQNSSLKLKSGAGVPNGQLLVVYNQFLHSAGDVFTADSYTVLRDTPADDTDFTHIGRIPTYSTKDKTYALSDCFDFRQVTRNGFFIIQATVTNGVATIPVAKDYRNVIAVGAKLWWNGMEAGTTVSAISETTITATDNSTYSGTVHVVVNTNTASDVAEPFNETDRKLWAPLTGQAITYDATYFLDRWDRVVITKKGAINYIYGTPGVNKYPDAPEDSMPLAKLILPAYTIDAADVKYANEDNRRYTMRDIGKLEDRIENLEYYTSLTMKELDTAQLKITDAEGLDRFKSGFFVSDFRDFGVFKPMSTEFRASLDTVNGYMEPYTYDDSVDLLMNETDSTNFAITGDMITLPYLHEEEFGNPYGTRSETVNPYLVIAWDAELSLNPARDSWVETEWEPTITNVTNLSNTVVNNRSVTISSTVDTRASNQLGANWRSNSTTTTTNAGTIVESTSSRTVTNRTTTTNLIGVSVIPLMRTRTITFRVVAAKPETRFWANFDGVDVSRWCRLRNENTQAFGAWGEALVTNAMGELEGQFRIPPNTFNTGTKTFALADINTVEFPDAGTECEASADYTAQGTLRTLQNTVAVVNTTTNTVNTVTTFNRVTRISATWNPPPPSGGGGGGGGETNSFNMWTASVSGSWASPTRVDPIAQSFDTFGIGGPGMFVTKIDLFFDKKDPVMPVTIELRDMVNGYPVNDIIPGSTVSLSPSQVNTDSTSVTPTSFVFRQPIWLDANQEYAFVVKSPSSRYHIWISELGEKVINEDRIVGKQPHMGTIFKSQNASTWTPFQYEDIKFSLFRAKFDTATSGDWEFNNTGVPTTRRVMVSDMKTTSGSNLVTIKHLNHGMQVNEKVNVFAEPTNGMTAKSPDTSTVFNGITMSEIYGERIVTELVDIDHYKIQVSSSATLTGNFEDFGRYVYVDGHSNFCTFAPSMEDFIPSGAEIRYAADLITGKDYDGGQTPKVAMTRIAVKNEDAYRLPVVGLCQNALNEAGVPSVSVIATAKTDNEYISPVINVSGNEFMISSRALNKPQTTTEDLASFDAGNAASKAVSQTIKLKTNATSLRIYTTENKQELDGIEIWYRTAINGDIDTKLWTYFAPTSNVKSSDTETFTEIERSADGLPEFNEFEIKVILKGTDSTKAPRIADLRAIAVA